MEGKSTRNREAKGIALIVALLVLLVLSTMGAAMVFVTQTEIWSSANYRTMLQARYAAEAGVQSAINWFEYTYTPPTTSQLSTNFSLNTYPVQCSTGCTSNGSAIVLSAMDGVTSNYPLTAQQTSFNSTLYNASVPGTNVNTATFQVSAKLLRATSTGYLTWQITSTGKASGASSGTIKGGQVQLVTTYEQSSTTGTSQTLSYGLFATGTGCNSMTISTGITTDSYNSSSGPYSSSKNTTSGGDIGSNGSLLSSGTTNIHGNLWLQHPSVGSCPSADIQYSGSLTYNNADTLTSTYSPPSPNPVSTPTTTTVLSGGTTTLSPGTLYGNIIASGTNTLSFPSAGTYDINSITASGSLTFQLPSSGGQVILNIGGNSAGAISLSGVILANPNANQIANDFIIYYAGTSGFTASGFTSGAAVLYAPNAPVTLSGSTPWYGAIVSKTFTDSGGAAVHFDTALETAFGTGTGSSPGPYRQVGFTWSKF
jgi:Tfp pilus assembly protein PilX